MEGDPYSKAKDGLPARNSGRWALRKHHFLDNYCGITTVSMRSRFKLVYLDVMAGPGRCRISETGEEFPGSPLVAMDHDFSEFMLIEEDPILASALKQRIGKHPKASKVRIIPGSWLDAVASGELEFDVSTLVVAFVDPTGLSQVPLSAMRALAKNPRIDLLVTIQHRLGIVWNKSQYLRSKADQTALDAFLGDQAWRDWAEKDPTEFGHMAIDQFCSKLAQDAFRTTRHISVPENNPLYRFTLFSRHPRAEDFWLKILKIDDKGQRELL